jgi:signal transduction histidine kinase
LTSPSNVNASTPSDGSVAKELSSVASDFAQSGNYLVSIQLQDGSWLNFSSSKSPEASLLTTNSLPLYMAVALGLALLSLWAIRQLAAPYQMLETAVREIGEDLYRPGLEESGFGDFRAAARAVNSMQRKLQQYVSDREYLAAALAHDLRTPITRMKLRCELLGKTRNRSLLLTDLSELERITQSVVDFATLNTVEENVERIDLVSLVESVIDGFPRRRISFEQPAIGFLVAEAKPTAVRRGISNLIENAMRYADTADVRITEAGEMVDIVVEDDGPGIPENQLQYVIRPFYRLDDSRNRLTGGTGLGLAIVDEVARGHGGSLTLSNRSEGGLMAVLSLPKRSRIATATAA